MSSSGEKFVAYAVSLSGVVKYIGITTKPILKRWAQHCQPKRRTTALTKAIKKYGAASFTVSHVASAWDEESLNFLEQILIAQHQTFGVGGYNLTSGGSQGMSFSEASIARMRGKKSLETRQRMSDSAKKRYSSIEGKAAHSDAQKRRWENKNERAIQAARAAEQANAPGRRDFQRAVMKKMHSNPEYRKKLLVQLAVARSIRAARSKEMRPT